jgi:type IV pilus assembly protein PilA
MSLLHFEVQDMQREKGFSLIELLIVVAIISLIAAIAIPNLRKARQGANSASAVQSLRTITTAQQLFEFKNKRFGTLAELAPEGTLDVSLQSGSKSSYLFAITVSSGAKKFSVNATPIEAPTEFTHYFVDETTVIRFNLGAPADGTSLPIPK